MSDNTVTHDVAKPFDADDFLWEFANDIGYCHGMYEVDRNRINWLIENAAAELKKQMDNLKQNCAHIASWLHVEPYGKSPVVVREAIAEAILK